MDTELEAWRFVKMRLMTQLGPWYLCPLIQWGIINKDIQAAMLDKIDRHPYRWKGDPALHGNWPQGRRGLWARIAFCNRMIRELSNV